jgi:small subunit ribosomal protein S14
MAKESMIQRELKRQKLVLKFSKKRQVLKELFQNATSLENQFESHRKLEKLPRNSSKIRLRSRCWKTGRPSGVYSDFGLCRHMIRDMAHNGLLPGVHKASW